uniref:Large ribosomal subunit protein uL1c n=2 Tax=Pyropia yezoensis TaxID=2788 RepID=RK1_PYRYE|nr:ribosomal protein L1 [Neopyropia yezoensis]Q1XDE9.1 RecName: Full=Large ribosomal subunit protein uL1c; AltName: Full=50S ribosomal protein L1, chloroplastic [Neopyropia yezoensis]AGH27666.1 ribosomal protein L1 [Neopyropia yezoensis]QFZ67002.1 ribosomal protein L1 [Neopyropia yezoensis]ULU28975.1 ribosomal protein L1 [Neopyropia yezoensis]WKD83497.1 ribosomal protein L1 [Neopyropia yezoensis]BAE92462.1 50S ribosomal protein L1 [Neopyropia yezoensis]
MKKFSRRLTTLKSKVEPKLYTINEAVSILKATSNAKFKETAEAHIALGLNPKYADQQLRATVILPKGTGKLIKVAVIAKGEKLTEAISAGADVSGSEELIDEILKGRLDFDKLIATPDVMPLIAKLGRVLGPRGLMPSPKAGTVTLDVAKAVNEFKGGKVEYRVDRTGIIHVPFGKSSFSQEDLVLNLQTIKESIDRNKPSGAKGKYWKTFFLSSTMGPSIQIDITSLL